MIPGWLSALERIGKDDPDRPALFCEQDGFWTSYGMLSASVRRLAESWTAPRRRLAFLFFENKRADVEAYLGLMAAGHVPALLDPKLDGTLVQRLITAYCPEMIVRDGKASLAVASEGGQLHPELGLLLSTSGSTGSPKMVRLGLKAIDHNARSIAKALAIGPRDRAMAHLPLHYSYGLSVLHTHLLAGAGLVLTGRSMFEIEFWDMARDQGCTSLATTPFHVSMIERLGLDALDCPAVSVITQAGGRLDREAAHRMYLAMKARGGRFYVMYGQTEASPRMATLDPADFLAHPGSVGRALSGGAFNIADAGSEALPGGRTGEIVYRGPNVMMGYAEERADLARADENGGVLRTGDVGHLDDDGFLFVTGRTARFAKVAGVRVSLDEIEALAGGRVAAVDGDGKVVLFVEGLSQDDIAPRRRELAGRLHLPSGGVVLHPIDVLPVTAKGKVDYARLKELA